MKEIRDFSAFHSVRLPNLDANAAQSLGRAILAAAEGATLSEGAREALDDVAAALDALVDVARNRLSPIDEGKPDTRQADIDLDAAWSSTHGLLTAWAKLPNEPKAKLASELRARLFPDGLKFTQLRFATQWSESDIRLALIEKERLDVIFEALGGAEFLKALRDTHRVYGDALGITKAQELPSPEPNLRESIARLADALRVYVLQVTAMIRKGDPQSAELAETLLAPIENR